MLTVGYAGAFLGPLLGGVALDLGGGRRSPFIPITVAAALMVLAALIAPVSGGAGREVVQPAAIGP
jgi:hypothetical protein